MNALATKHQVDRQLVDEAIEAYVDWREECAAVWDASDRWGNIPRVDAAVAFSASRAALDREECASHAYAGVLARIAARQGRERLRPDVELAHPRSAGRDSPREAA
jgi:hypothetical protein